MTSRADTEKRQAAVADLAEVLATRLPTAGLEGLTEQIGALHLTTPQARAVLDHLRARPDALTSGSSEGPAGLARLLDALAEKYPEVRRMQCGRCGAERRLPYRRDGARICNRCYNHTLLKTCVRCGELGNPSSVKVPARSAAAAVHTIRPVRNRVPGAASPPGWPTASKASHIARVAGPGSTTPARSAGAPINALMLLPPPGRCAPGATTVSDCVSAAPADERPTMSVSMTEKQAPGSATGAGHHRP